MFWLAAVAIGAWFVQRTWMCWMDPEIDFGVQLYIPWRITLGEHLGRDFLHPYGPLSSYVNAALFSIFGVSIRTLVVANLLIYAGIFYTLFQILRRAFGYLPAAFASLVGLIVYGFGHYTTLNNYTFAAPYSHEATHGLLLILILTLRQMKPASPPRRWAGWIDGLLLGLICLSKIEIVFAAVIVLGFSAARHFAADRPPGHSVRIRPLQWAIGAGAVVFVAWLVLAAATSPRAAAITATSGFLAPLWYPAYVKSSQILTFLGVNEPARNLAILALYGGAAAAVVGLMTDFADTLGRMSPDRARVLGALSLAGLLALLVYCLRTDHLEMGRILPGLLVLSAIFLTRRCRREFTARRRLSARSWSMLMLGALAVALMARMALWPKIYHFGFIQSMVAAVFLVGFFLGEWPRQMRLAGRSSGYFLIAAGLIFGAFALSLARTSLSKYAIKTQPMGLGGDRFYGIDHEILAGHKELEAARDYLATHASPGATLLVAPEGIMLNYWTRMKHPLRITNLLPATMVLNGHDVLDDLNATPPDYVVLVTRTVDDEDVPPFGLDRASGRDILPWLEKNYTSEAHFGGNPLRPSSERDFGLWIMKHRPGPGKAE